MNCEQRVKKIETMLDAQEEERKRKRQNQRWMWNLITLIGINVIFVLFIKQQLETPSVIPRSIGLIVMPIAFAVMQIMLSSLFLRKEDFD